MSLLFSTGDALRMQCGDEAGPCCTGINQPKPSAVWIVIGSAFQVINTLLQ